jgi:hypothetical protein
MSRPCCSDWPVAVRQRRIKISHITDSVQLIRLVYCPSVLAI